MGNLLGLDGFWVCQEFFNIFLYYVREFFRTYLDYRIKGQTLISPFDFYIRIHSTTFFSAFIRLFNRPVPWFLHLRHWDEEGPEASALFTTSVKMGFTDWLSIHISSWLILSLNYFQREVFWGADWSIKQRLHSYSDSINVLCLFLSVRKKIAKLHKRKQLGNEHYWINKFRRRRKENKPFLCK